MIRLLLVFIAVFLLWQFWKKLTLYGDKASQEVWRKWMLYLGGGALIAFGLWMAASGRINVAWVGLLGLMAWLRRGMFLYQIIRKINSFRSSGFDSFFQSAKRAAEETSRANRSAGRMSREKAANILGVSTNASRRDITNAFREKMRAAHPDVGGNEKIAQQLNEARDTLLRG